MLGLKSSKLEDLKYIKSHAQGLAQCRKFINKQGLIPIQHIDTAGAAEEVSRLENPKIAAIASNMAAKIYNLKILKNESVYSIDFLTLLFWRLENSLAISFFV